MNNKTIATLEKIKHYKAFMIFFIFLYIFSFHINSAIGQSTIEVDKFRTVFEVETHKHNWEAQLKENRNELQFVFSLLFVIYKEVFSSQDMDSCVFTPSCSVYAIETIKQKGITVGIMDAFDRISRCNPGRHKDYKLDPETKKYVDPVK